jgi:mono/diheme cytochrome c family protein
MTGTSSVIAGLAAAGLLLAGWQVSRGDDDWGGELAERWGSGSRVAAADNPVYREECGSCHMAYPPGLLPARSWERIMDGLANHFGDNAELDAAAKTEITRYLTARSADGSEYRHSRRLLRTLSPDSTSLRITETPYIRHEHSELPAQAVAGNPAVRSLSNCNACHAQAEQGSFSESEVRIPGYANRDD